jgi:hypothetical protein
VREEGEEEGKDVSGEGEEQERTGKVPQKVYGTYILTESVS